MYCGLKAKQEQIECATCMLLEMEVLSCKAGFHCSYIILTYMYSLHFCLVLWHGYHRKYILCAWIKQSISCCRSWFFSNEQCIFPRCTVFIQNMFAFNEGECILVVMFFFLWKSIPWVWWCPMGFDWDAKGFKGLAAILDWLAQMVLISCKNNLQLSHCRIFLQWFS